VDARQDADLGGQRADLIHRAAVDALAVEQPLLDDLLLHLVEADVDLYVEVVAVLFAELLLEVHDGLGQALFADVLVVGVEGVFDLAHAVIAEVVEHVVVDGGLLEGELRLADRLDDRVDELHDLDVRLVGQLDALHEDVLADFLGLGLDHNDLFMGRGDRDEALAGVALILRRVHDELAVEIGDIRGGGGAVPGDVGIGDDERRADGGDDLDGVVIVLREDHVGEHDIVAELFVEQRTHRAVDQAGDEHAPVGRTALAAVEAAGDTADGIHAFLDLDGEGEIVDAGLRQRGCDRGHEDDGVAVAADGLCVAELCDLAGFDRKGAAADLSLKNVVVWILLVRNHGKPPCFYGAWEV